MESLTPVEIENAQVVIIGKDVPSLSEDEMKKLLGDAVFVFDDWMNGICLRITELEEKSNIIRGSTLNSHLKNLNPMVKFFYTEYLENYSMLRQKLESIVTYTEGVFIGHYPDQKLSKEAGSRIFHFMVELIEFGKETRIENQKLAPCVVNGCEQKAIKSHTISRAHNFKNSINYYILKSRIRDEGKANSGIYLGRVISSNASTRHMFCAEHDKNLFLPIEGDSNLDIENPEHLFLQNWRTFLWDGRSDNSYLKNMRKELEKNHQLLNQRTLSVAVRAACIDEALFQQENKDIVYFALTFTNAPPMLASFCQDLAYLLPQKSSSEQKQMFYFQMLNNRNKQCLIVSGFRTPEMVEALTLLKNVYEKDNCEFWQKIFNFIPLKKNVFFTETFAFNSVLANKLKQIHLISLQNENKGFMKELPTTFSKKELFSFFGLSKVYTNI